MKIVLIIFFILTSFVNLFAQIDIRSNYYRLINQAELCICNGHHSDALTYYDSSFLILENSFPYYKDAYNAFILSIELNNDIYILKYWDYMCRMGIDTNFIKNSILINTLKNKNYWPKIINDIKIYSKKEFEELNILFEIFEDDQKIRKECEKKSTDNKYIIYKDTIMKIDSINYIRLIKELKTNGFPFDYKVNGCIPSNPPIYKIIIKHNAMWNRLWLDSLIIKNINELRFHPLLYSDIMDYHNEQFSNDLYRSYGTNNHAIIKGKLFIFSEKLKLDLKNQINFNRQSINLEDIDSYNKKCIFQFFNPQYIFIYPSMFSVLDIDQGTADILFDKWKIFEVTKGNQN